MQLRYLQTLTEIAGEKSSTIVFPIPMNVMENLGRILEPGDGSSSRETG